MKKSSGYTWKNPDGTYGARISFAGTDGKRKYRKIGEGKNGLRTKSEADDWISDRKKEIKPGGKARRGKKTWDDAAALFVREYAIPPVWKDGELQAGMRSWQDARQRIRTLTEYLSGEALDAINFGRLRRLRGELLLRKATRRSRKTGKVYAIEQALSPSTVNRIMATCSAVMTAAVDEGWIETNPFPSTRKKRAALISTGMEKPRQRILTKREEARLLAACDAPQKYRASAKGRKRPASRKDQSTTSPRRHLRPILIALLDTGMRWGELKGLRWSAVDLEERLLTIEASHTKTLTARVVGITDRLYAELVELQRHREDEISLVFGIRSNIENSWKTVRRLAGLENLRLHDLRHTAATRMIQRGTAASLVGRILGHTVPQTTYRYTNMDAVNARAAAQGLNEMVTETVN